MDLKKETGSMVVLKQVHVIHVFDAKTDELLFINNSLSNYEMDMIDGGRSGILRLEHQIHDKQLLHDFSNGKYDRRVLKLRLIGIARDVMSPDYKDISVVAEIEKSVLETVTDREFGNLNYDASKENNKLVFYMDFHTRDYTKKEDIWSPINFKIIEDGSTDV